MSSRIFACCSRDTWRAGYEKVTGTAADGANALKEGLGSKPKPSDKFRTASRTIERIVIAVLFAFIVMSAVAVIITVYKAYQSDDFKDADDSMAFQMKISNNPFKVSHVTYALGISAAIALVIIIAGVYAIIRGGTCCNTALVVALIVITILLLALTIILYVFLRVYGKSAGSAKDTMCSTIEAAGGCSTDTLPDWIQKACSIMSRIISFCGNPCGFIDDMCGGSFDQGLSEAWRVFHSSWVCTLNCMLVSIISSCFLFELCRNSSVLDKLDCCHCLDRYDRTVG